MGISRSNNSLKRVFASFLATDSAQKVPKAAKADARFLELVEHFLKVERRKKYIQQVTLEDLQLLQLWLAEPQTVPFQKNAWTQTTIAHSCKLLKSVFKKLMRMEIISKNPCAFWSVPAGEHKMGRPMSPAEFARLIAVVPTWYIPILHTLRLTGVRGASVAALTWEQVDFNGGRVFFTTRKGGLKKTKVIPIPMFPELRTILNDLLEPGIKDNVFLDGDGNPITAQLISTVGSKCLRKAGITGTTIYGLRRALATDLMDAGMDTKTISKLMGHSSEKQLDRYTGYASLAPLERALNLVRGENEQNLNNDRNKDKKNQ